MFLRKADLDIDRLWLFFSSVFLNLYADHTQTVTGWALLQRDRFVLGTVPPTAVSMLTGERRGRLSWAQPWECFAGFGPWGRAGVQELLFSLGHHKAQQRGLTVERLIGEIQARQTRWQHVKLGPLAHLCTLCQCHPQCHHCAFQTWVMSSVQFDYRPYKCDTCASCCSCPVAWPGQTWNSPDMDDILVVCSSQSLATRRVLAAFEWEPLIQHPTYFTIPPLAWAASSTGYS